MGATGDQTEDIIQETFLRLISHLDQEGDQRNLPGWIYRVAHNLCIDWHRANQRSYSEGYDEMEIRYGAVADDGPDPEQNVIEQEYMARVSSLLSGLTAQQRSSVLLRAEGIQYDEIGKILRVSMQRAALLVKRGLEKLAAQL